jgi:hypothetical protein
MWTGGAWRKIAGCSMMPDIQFVVDEKGRKKAVVIDLKKYGDLWEDFYDTLVARQRAREPRESLAAVKTRLRRAGKLNG